MKAVLATAAAGLAALFAAGPSSASTISINTLLANPSFEGGTTAGCPNSWSCGGSPGVGVYAPGAAQYTIGSDGLASGVVPDGSNAVFIPGNGISGSGTLRQVTGTNYLAGNDYTFTFWVGVPTHNLNGATQDTVRGGTGTRIEVGFVEGASGVQDGLPNALSLVPDLTAAGDGMWLQETITLTAAQLAASGATNQAIGLLFFVSTGNGNQPLQVDFDIAAVPLPAGLPLPLFAAALGVFGLIARRGKRKINLEAV